MRYVNKVVAYIGYHILHSFTCHALPHGVISCRVGYNKKENNNGTCAVMIEIYDETRVLPNGKEVILKKVRECEDQIIPQTFRQSIKTIGQNPRKPFPGPDIRFLAIQKGRRSFYSSSGTPMISNTNEINYNGHILFNPNFNGPVVDYNDVLTAVEGCNTAIYQLGSECGLLYLK